MIKVIQGIFSVHVYMSDLLSFENLAFNMGTVDKIARIVKIIESSVGFKWHCNLRPAEVWITLPFVAVTL